MGNTSGFKVKPLTRKQIKKIKKDGSEACRTILDQLSSGTDVALTSDQIEDVMDDFLGAAFPGKLDEIDENLSYKEALDLFSDIMGVTFGGVEKARKN